MKNAEWWDTNVREMDKNTQECEGNLTQTIVLYFFIIAYIHDDVKEVLVTQIHTYARRTHCKYRKIQY